VVANMASCRKTTNTFTPASLPHKYLARTDRMLRGESVTQPAGERSARHHPIPRRTIRTGARGP